MSASRSRKRNRSESSSSGREDHRMQQNTNDFGRILGRIERRLDALERKNKRQKNYRPRSRSTSSKSSSVLSESDHDLHREHEPSRDVSNNCDSLVNESHNQEFLTILGEAEKEEKSFSDPVQPELAARWAKILQSGLPNESKTELVKKYLPPENCTELYPPKVNLEVKKAVPENTLRRDTRLSQLQSQIGAATSAIAWLITDMLKGEGGAVNMKYIECLNDIGRLLSDVHHSESVSRRELIALNINKDLKDSLVNTSISEWLFGKDLDGTIKTAKDLEKSSDQLKIRKKNIENQPSTSKQGNFKRPFLLKRGTLQSGRISRVPSNSSRKLQTQRFPPLQSKSQTRYHSQNRNRHYHRY